MRLVPRKPFGLQRASPAPHPADKLRELARHVLRLGQRGWADPETFVLAKHTLAGELRALARELER